MIRKILPLAFGLTMAATGLSADTISCAIAQNGSAPYSRNDLASLLPASQIHRISGDHVKGPRGQGLVTRNDSSRVKWEYALALSAQSDRPATLSYTLIPANGKLIIRLNPGQSKSLDKIRVKDFEFRFEIGSAMVGGVMVHDKAAVAVRYVAGQCQFS